MREQNRHSGTVNSSHGTSTLLSDQSVGLKVILWYCVDVLHSCYPNSDELLVLMPTPIFILS